nr:MAG TPA: PORTAL PROTEIN [Caudoviricetes sp.]
MRGLRRFGERRLDMHQDGDPRRADIHSPIRARPACDHLEPEAVGRAHPPRRGIRSMGGTQRPLQNRTRLLRPRLPRRTVMGIGDRSMGSRLRAEEIHAMEHVGQLPHRSRLRGIAPIRSRPDHTSHHTGRLPRHPHPHDERAKGRQDPGTLRAGETPAEQEDRRRRDQRARPRSRMRRASRRLGRSQTQLHAYRIIDQKEVLMDYSQQELSSLANRLADKIQFRRPSIGTHTDYVLGKRGKLKFASKEFKRYMSDRFSDFSDNWCLPVAQAPVERIKFKGFVPYDDVKLGTGIMKCLDRNDFERGLQEAALMMTTTGRAFALVTQVDGRARITFEHPDSAAVIYDARTGQPSAGFLIQQGDDKEYGTLMLPGWTVSMERKKMLDLTDQRVPPDVYGWKMNDPQPTGLDTIPLREFRNQMLLDNAPISDIAHVESMQDTVNVVWAYLLNALDYASLPARVILGGDPLVEPVYNEEGQQVGEKPIELDKQVLERIYQFTGDNVNLGEWSSSNLNVFIPVIEKAVEHIAAETRTPGHYLLTNAEVPATGYEVAEAGLVSKTIERISFLKSPIRDICSIAMRYENDTDEADIIADSKVQFATPQYRSETLMADAMLKYKQLGFPIQWVAEQMGQSSDEVQRIMRMRADEMADPELESLNRALQIGGADGGRIAGAGLQPETAGDVGADGGQGRSQNMEQGRRQ